MVASAMVCPISAKFVHDGPMHRSIWKPTSFVELSLHARPITPVPGLAVAVRLVGAAGGPAVGWVVACAMFEDPKVPSLLYARTS